MPTPMRPIIDEDLRKRVRLAAAAADQTPTRFINDAVRRAVELAERKAKTPQPAA